MVGRSQGSGSGTLSGLAATSGAGAGAGAGGGALDLDGEDLRLPGRLLLAAAFAFASLPQMSCTRWISVDLCAPCNQVADPHAPAVASGPRFGKGAQLEIYNAEALPAKSCSLRVTRHNSKDWETKHKKAHQYEENK